MSWGGGDFRGGGGSAQKLHLFNLVIPHINTIYTYTIFSITLLHITTLCLNLTLPCVDLVDVIMGDILLIA